MLLSGPSPKWGISRVMKLAEDMGIASLTPEDRNLSLALGSIAKGVTPLELAGAFVPVANGGIRYEDQGHPTGIGPGGQSFGGPPAPRCQGH